MNLSKIPLRGLSIATLLMAFLLSAASCGGESEPTPAAPDPTPTPALSDVLTKAGERMAAMQSAKFGMVDEKETGAKFFETTFKSMEAEVKAPDSFRMLVDVVSPAFGFIEIEMMAVGDQAFMKFSKDAPWGPLPVDGVPFNFRGLGGTFSDVIHMVRDGDGAITGSESVLGNTDHSRRGNGAVGATVEPHHRRGLGSYADFDYVDRRRRSFSAAATDSRPALRRRRP